MNDMYKDADGRIRLKTDEITELRAYFAAHMAMDAAHNRDTFAEAYAKANRARDNLLALARGLDPIARAA